MIKAKVLHKLQIEIGKLITNENKVLQKIYIFMNFFSKKTSKLLNSDGVDKIY